MKKSVLPALGSEEDLPHLKIRDFSQSLPMLLLRGREAVMRYFRPSLLEHGVTEQQWRVLRALSTANEMEVMILANATYLLPPSLSRILKDLQRRGLVKRRSDRRDARRNLVAITSRGNELINTLSPQSEMIYAEITRCFGQQNYDDLQCLLRQLESDLHKMPVNLERRARQTIQNAANVEPIPSRRSR